MKRDEAGIINKLKLADYYLRNEWRSPSSVVSAAVLVERVLVSLSCPSPCAREGKEPIAKGRALHVKNPTLGDYWVVYERELEGDDRQRVIILPGDKPDDA